MKPVNLLPEQHRPKRASGKRSGVAYWALGGLGVLLLAVVAVVMSSNSVADKKDEVASLERETQALQARAGNMQPVADFLSIKQGREDSVRQLAGRRFDWERLTRELARVIPEGVYVKEVKAATDGSSVGKSSSNTTPAVAATPGAGQPAAALTGCAQSQRQVAAMLVRMKKLHLAEEAELTESKRIDEADAGASGSGAGGTGETPCTDYEFAAKVTFSADSLTAPPVSGDPVPASLGGGK